MIAIFGSVPGAQTLRMTYVQLMFIISTLTMLGVYRDLYLLKTPKILT